MSGRDTARQLLGLDRATPRGQGEDPPLPDAFLRAFQLTPERIALVQQINDLIRQRTAYGLREETVAKAPGYKVTWYNGSASWEVNWQRYKRGETVQLDANQVLVQGAKISDIRAIQEWLEPLPLYAASFEAKRRGFFDPGFWLQALYQRWRDEMEENGNGNL